MVVAATLTPGAELVDLLVARRFTGFSGVPCSLLGGVFQALVEPPPGVVFVPAVREDSALAVAAGMEVAGRRSVALMQNSGLGYCLNVSTSLCQIYQIPVLLVISWRGAYGDDAVEHDVIGARLPQILTAADIAHRVHDPTNPAEALDACDALLREHGNPVALLVRDTL